MVGGHDEMQDPGQALGDDFEAQVVSSVGEAFNNIAIHGYAHVDPPGLVDIDIEVGDESLVFRLHDRGITYDPTTKDPAPDRLPTSGMGIYIIHNFMDDVAYTPGSPPETPNVLTLTKLRYG